MNQRRVISMMNKIPQGFELLWSDISGLPTDVAGWNTFFNLPVNGDPFLSVETVGNLIILRGGGNIRIASSLFSGRANLMAADDKSGSIIRLNQFSFTNCFNMQYARFKAAKILEASVFSSDSMCTEYDLSSCTNLGPTVGYNGIWGGITGQSISLKVPAALMTCNGGNPDGDIQDLASQNAVTITTV